MHQQSEDSDRPHYDEEEFAAISRHEHNLLYGRHGISRCCSGGRVNRGRRPGRDDDQADFGYDDEPVFDCDNRKPLHRILVM